MSPLLVVLLLSVAIMKRGVASGSKDPAPKVQRATTLNSTERTELRAELAANSRGTHSTIGHVLITLQQRGLLSDDELGATKSESKRIGEATGKHAKAQTPFGSVVQSIPIIVDDEPVAWEIINPFAFIWYLCTLCTDFGNLMADAIRSLRRKESGTLNDRFYMLPLAVAAAKARERKNVFCGINGKNPA